MGFRERATKAAGVIKKRFNATRSIKEIEYDIRHASAELVLKRITTGVTFKWERAGRMNLSAAQPVYFSGTSRSPGRLGETKTLSAEVPRAEAGREPSA